jgi:hypothetical protein
MNKKTYYVAGFAIIAIIGVAIAIKAGTAMYKKIK